MAAWKQSLGLDVSGNPTSIRNFFKDSKTMMSNWAKWKAYNQIYSYDGSNSISSFNAMKDQFNIFKNVRDGKDKSGNAVTHKKPEKQTDGTYKSVDVVDQKLERYNHAMPFLPARRFYGN